MKPEAAITIAVVMLSVGFLFLVLPLLTVLADLPKVWRASRADGALLSGVLILTGAFFLLFLAGLIVVMFFKVVM